MAQRSSLSWIFSLSCKGPGFVSDMSILLLCCPVWARNWNGLSAGNKTTKLKSCGWNQHGHVGHVVLFTPEWRSYCAMRRLPIRRKNVILILSVSLSLSQTCICKWGAVVIRLLWVCQRLRSNQKSRPGRTRHAGPPRLGSSNPTSPVEPTAWSARWDRTKKKKIIQILLYNEPYVTWCSSFSIKNKTDKDTASFINKVIRKCFHRSNLTINSCPVYKSLGNPDFSDLINIQVEHTSNPKVFAPRTLVC